MTEWVGYLGLAAFALAWIPQSIDTIKAGRCEINRKFLILAAVGSFCLTLYAYLRDDVVFLLLNGLTTAGALLNLFYKQFPRTE